MGVTPTSAIVSTLGWCRYPRHFGLPNKPNVYSAMLLAICLLATTAARTQGSCAVSIAWANRELARALVLSDQSPRSSAYEALVHFRAIQKKYAFDEGPSIGVARCEMQLGHYEKAKEALSSARESPKRDS